jgi:16S rRNA (cytosine1402-N4)-methyltransferase
MTGAGRRYAHIPVLPEECLELLAPERDNELMVQGNMGEGGHAELFLGKFPTLRIIGIDADAGILERARERLEAYKDRVKYFTGWSLDFFKNYHSFVKSNMDFFKNYSSDEQIDLIFFDLGLSSWHYECSGRGFSFRKDEPLDMRFDTSQGETAADLVNNLPEADLADLLYNNGGERYSRRIARRIVETRRSGRINSSALLADIISGAVPPAYRHGKLHPATRSFQALRIAVNHELESLRPLLDAALAKLARGGRMGVISFHSGEDRIVKGFFKDEKETIVSITGKPLAPGAAERLKNPASRSAKLRVGVKQ